MTETDPTLVTPSAPPIPPRSAPARHRRRIGRCGVRRVRRRRAADDHLRAQAGGQESLPAAGRGRRDDHRPAAWGMNWPRQIDGYRGPPTSAAPSTAAPRRCPTRRCARDPWLKRMFAGYAFAIDYRDRRGHAHMLDRSGAHRRVTERPQPGILLALSRVGDPDLSPLGGGDVMKGFARSAKMTYAAAHAEVAKTGSLDARALAAGVQFTHADGAHPVACVDCHDPKTMELRVTRPGFLLGIRGAGRQPASRRPTSPASSAGARPIARRPTIRTRTPRARRCARSCAASATSSTTAAPRRRCSFPGAGPEGRADRAHLRQLQVPRRPPILRLAARRDGGRGPEGAAPGVRDVEPGYSRALRRRLRGLPHAVQARGRDEGVAITGCAARC